MTSNIGTNRFQNKELKLPLEYREQIETYVRSAEAGGTATNKPFRRTVDIWYLAMCIGVKLEEQINLPDKDTWGFITGAILANQPWRINAIELLGISYHESPYDSLKDIDPDPIKLANSYANAGIKYVLEYLEDGKSEKLSNLGTRLFKLVNENS